MKTESAINLWKAESGRAIGLINVEFPEAIDKGSEGCDLHEETVDNKNNFDAYMGSLGGMTVTAGAKDTEREEGAFTHAE
jgi:hypothetical protein